MSGSIPTRVAIKLNGLFVYWLGHLAFTQEKRDRYPYGSPEEVMNKALALLVLALTLISCSSTPTHYTVPQGYQTCRSNLDCPRGTYCGFVGVDTYAVCKQ